MLDEAIMCMISGESSSVSTLRTCLKTDEQNGFANALLAFELLRNSAFQLGLGSSTDNTNCEILACLGRLEINSTRLTARERFYGAAAIHWMEGNYRKAGSLLESSILASPKGDPIALRLAQDCYMAAGDSKNVLGCVTRCLQLSDQKSLFHGHLLGMLAVGYLENGRLLDAEETSNRSIAQTKGRDISALSSLMNTLQLTGRSSEVLAVAEEHLGNHEGLGMQILMFNKGSALAQRGNYRGASRIFDSMIDFIRLSSVEDNKIRMGSALVHATLLLWQISLHTEVSVQRWKDLANMWFEVSADLNNQSCRFPPLVSISYTMAMTGLATCSFNEDKVNGRLIGQNSKNAETIYLPEGASVKPGGSVKEESSLMAWLWKPLYSQKVVIGGGRDRDTAERGKEGADGDDGTIQDPKINGFTEKQLVDAASNHMKAAGSFRKIMDGSKSMTITRDSYVFAHKVKSTFQLVNYEPELLRFVNEHPDMSEKDWIVDICAEKVNKALVTFNSRGADGVVQTAQILNQIKSLFSRLGGTAAQRDILDQTLIESMLRCESWTDARLLLSERTTLAPNDAQSWRRQASVLGRLGHRELAEVATYTAWQLGIGQGGFGGPR